MTTDSAGNTRSILSAVKRAFPYLAVLAGLLPVLLYAWLAQYMRPMIDDFYTLRIGRELGPWDGMRFHFKSWSGGYTNFYIKSAMAPLDTLAPAATSWLLIALWLMAALCLTRGLLPRFRIERTGWKLELVVAACIITASIYSQYSPQTFFWHAAVIPYALPLAILTMYLALLAGSPLNSATGKQIAWRAVAGTLLCFLSAGFNEIVVAIQATWLTWCLLVSLALCRGKVRRNLMLLLGFGWLATLASLLIQGSSPGVTLRLEAESMLLGMAISDYLGWVDQALGIAIQLIGRRRIFGGFALLFCVSFGVSLCYFRPRANCSPDKAYRLSSPLLWLALLAQLLLLSLLWAHQSDDPQVFGRFSMAYTVTIFANAVLVLLCAMIFWQRRRISVAITRNMRFAWISLCAALAAACILFWLTQFRSIHWRASSYFYLSSLLILSILAGQLSGWLRDKQLRRLFLLSVLSTLVPWVLLGTTVFIGLVAKGHVKGRILTPASYFMVFSALVWGASLGCLIKQWLCERGASQHWVSRLAMCGAIVALMIGAIIVSSQLRLVPDFARYAREWDERHQSIIDQRDQGVRDVTVWPLSFNMHRFLGLSDDPEVRFRYALGYYGLDSISEVES